MESITTTSATMLSLGAVATAVVSGLRLATHASLDLSTFRKESVKRTFDAIVASEKNRRVSLHGMLKKAKSLHLEDFHDWLGVIDPTPYPNGLRYNLSVEAVRSLSEELMARYKQVYDEVGSMDLKRVTFQTTFLRLSAMEARLEPLMTSVTMIKDVSPCKKLRDAASVAAEKMSKLGVQMAMRKDLYLISEKLMAMHNSKAAELRGEDLRLLERTFREQKRKGLHLEDPAKAGRVKEIQLRMAELSTQYMRNLGEDNTTFTLTLEELKGLPEANLNRLKKDASGAYIMTLSYPDYFPAMEHVEVAATRKKLATAFKSRCKEQNTPLIEEMIQLRHEQATILGYPTHGDYILEVNMAKSPKIAKEFLQKVASRMKPLAEKELAEMLVLKKELEGKEAEKIEDWDYRFYSRLREEKEFKIDKNALKPYFPLDVVEKGMLEIYQEILGLTFKESKGDALAWHDDVRLFTVEDTATGDFVGTFYLDLFPRPGKYGHACCMGLQPGCGLSDNKDGSYPVQHPASAMIANFTKPTATEPSNLTHDEVVTFFHEFGHVMHQICSRGKLMDFAGTRVERDFVEAPSQMLENWCWEKEALLRMSGKVDGKSLPDELLDRLIKSRLANVGLFNQRQLLFGLFDLTIHSMPKADTAKEFARFQKDIMGIDVIPGTNFAASFGHLMGGYDSRYYGYMWAEVFSADMFASRFKKEGIFNPKTGMDYRAKIIGMGGTKDANDLIRDFLGRDPTEDAFLMQKGVGH